MKLKQNTQTGKREKSLIHEPRINDASRSNKQQ